VKREAMEELMGPDLLLERVRSGIGAIAEVGVIVKCNYRGYFYSMKDKKRISEEAFEECREQSFQIGEGDCVPGLELALRNSHVGEILKVYSASKFAYGYVGRCFAEKGGAGSKVTTIPPDMDLEYEIEITSHLHDNELEASIAEKCEREIQKVDGEEDKSVIYHRFHTLQAMQFRKEAGNRWFSYNDFPRAAKAYSRATQLADGYFNPNKGKKPLGETAEEASKVLQEQHEQDQRPVDQEDKDLVDVYIACLNNLAACKLSLKEYSSAKDICVQVLELSPLNGKALLRAAKATFALDLFEECEACLKKLLSLENLEDSLQAAARVEMQRLKKAIADYKNNTKEMQKRIANKLFNANNTKESTDKNMTATDKMPTKAEENASSVEASPIMDDHKTSGTADVSNVEKTPQNKNNS
jgi:tetratricopeptide (TPR) repeat protein